MNVLILTADSNGAYPVPASKGGAVATLIEYLAEGNNNKQLCEMQILSYYDKKAYDLSLKYPNIKFIWVKIPCFIKFFDLCIFYCVKILKKNEKAVSFKSTFSLLFYIWKARKIVRKTSADKIIIENNIPLALSMKRINFTGDLYYHLHNVPRIDGHCRDVLNNVDKFLCVSRYVGNKICNEQSAIGEISKDKIEVLFNCVNTELFRPIATKNSKIIYLKKRYGIEPNDSVLIFTGRLTAEKGADVMLEALTKLPSNYKALIVGSYHYNADIKSDYQDKLHSLAKKLCKRVVFTGYVKHDDLPYLYNLADIAVLPSIWEEPAGLTNLEAMACGIPIVTTNSGGIPEYVGDSIIVNRTELLSKNIADEINNIMNDKEKYLRLSEYSINRIRKDFDKNDYIDKFIQIIKEKR